MLTLDPHLCLEYVDIKPSPVAFLSFGLKQIKPNTKKLPLMMIASSKHR